MTIVAALVGSFRLGLERGFDHTIGVEAYGRMLFAIGAAVSDEVHGKHGYVIDNVVDSALTNGGLTADPNILASLGTSFPENLQNPVLLDSTLHQAMKSPNTVSAVRSASADDPGMVDFVRLGFDLFGYRLLSLYLTYVLLFVIPFWAFWQAFRNEPSSIAILAIAAVAHLAILASDFFDLTGTTLGSVTNPRFLSILGVIPALHIALAMLHRHPPHRRMLPWLEFKPACWCSHCGFARRQCGCRSVSSCLDAESRYAACDCGSRPNSGFCGASVFLSGYGWCIACTLRRRSTPFTPTKEPLDTTLSGTPFTTPCNFIRIGAPNTARLTTMSGAMNCPGWPQRITLRAIRPLTPLLFIKIPTAP
jgi:hypothetical protein